MPDPSFYARLGRLSAVIFALPSCMAAGWVIGHYVLDRFLTPHPWGTVVLTLVGAMVGFYQVFQILVSDQKEKDDQR